jgi:hypothetical protein
VAAAYPSDDSVALSLPKAHASGSGIPGTSTPERKVVHHMAVVAAVASSTIALGAMDSEVISTCPVVLSPSPVVVQGSEARLQTPPESPVSLLGPRLGIGSAAGRFAFVDIPESLANGSAEGRKGDPLACAFPTDAPGQRTCSVIPSELYSGMPPVSECAFSCAAFPEPSTVAVQGGPSFGRDALAPVATAWCDRPNELSEPCTVAVTECVPACLHARELHLATASVDEPSQMPIVQWQQLTARTASHTDEVLMATARTSSHTHEALEEADAHWETPWELSSDEDDSEAASPLQRQADSPQHQSAHLVPPLLLLEGFNSRVSKGSLQGYTSPPAVRPVMCEINPCDHDDDDQEHQAGLKGLGEWPPLSLPEGLGGRAARSSTRLRPPPVGVSPCVCEINPWDDDDEDSEGLRALGGEQEEALSQESFGGPVMGGGASFGEQSLPWRDNAWTGSTWRPEGAGSCLSASSWQPRVLCALPTATPAGLLFGLLTPLLLGWHIVLENPGFCPGSGGETLEGAWLALQEHGAALDGLLLTAAHCDVLTRCAMEECSSLEGPWSKATGPLLSLAALRSCAIFGPCLTPPVAQSFLAALQPFGLR